MRLTLSGYTSHSKFVSWVFGPSLGLLNSGEMQTKLKLDPMPHILRPSLVYVARPGGSR
jgi:hypothetical protein